MGDVAVTSCLFGAFDSSSSYLDMTIASSVNDVDMPSESSLLEAHKKLIHFVAKPYVRPGVSEDDLMQEGYIAFLGAARTWRSDQGAQLWTYAIKFVRGAMVRYLSNEVAEPAYAGLRDGCAKRASAPDGGMGETPISAYIENCENCDTSPEDVLSLRECGDLLEGAKTELSDVERQILKLRYEDGLSLKHIARELGLPSTSTARFYHGAIAKLRTRVEAQL